MPTRSLFHLLLSIPTLVGIGIILILFVRGGSNELSEEPAPRLALQAWSGIFNAFPAEMPSVYPDTVEESPETVDDLSEEEKLAYPRSNAFILSCSLLVILGSFGIALMGGLISTFEPIWYGLLRIGALCAVTLGSFIFLGFNLAFPGDSSSILPIPSFYLPGETDSIEYGLNGISEWADLLFIGCYALFFATLILSLAHGAIRSTPLFLIAIPASTLVFPLVVSWKWGGGWLDALMNNIDFAGASVLHWHAGLAVLLIGLVACINGRARKQGNPVQSLSLSPSGIGLYLLGGLFYLVALLAINTGSALESTPQIVAPILQATLIAAAVSGILGLVWASFSPRKPFVRYLIVGAAGGMVAVSGATDSLTWEASVVFGVLSGLLVPGATLLLEHLAWRDPLSIGAIHGIGGMIAVLGTPFVAEESATIPGQLTMLISTPLLTLAGTFLVTLIAAAAGFLLLGSATEKTPPPIPSRETEES